MTKKKKLDFVDILCLILAFAPYLFCMILKILTEPQTEGLSITGARIYWTVPMPIQDLPITESQIVSWATILFVFGMALFLTRKMRVRRPTVRQHIAELIVEKIDDLVCGNMGSRFNNYTPYIMGLLFLSVFSSLSCLLGLRSPTADINIIAGWSILTFALMIYQKFRAGGLVFCKKISEPMVPFTPLNIIGDIAVPVAITFRHYGNILSGAVISTLVGTALAGLSHMILHGLPGWLGYLPFLRIGIPALMSIYFDLFSGALQAFIFCMLTMTNVSGSFPEAEYEEKKAKKLARREARIAAREAQAHAA